MIAAALNGLVMFVYSILLLQLNRGVLPREIGLKGGRLVAIIWAVLFYGFFSVILLIDQGKQLFGIVDAPEGGGDVHPAIPDGRPLVLPVLLGIGHEVRRQRAVGAHDAPPA